MKELAKYMIEGKDEQNQVNEGSTDRKLIKNWDLLCDAIGETQVLKEVWNYFSDRELSEFVESVATDYDVDLY